MYKPPPSPLRLPIASLDGEIYETASSPRPQHGISNAQLPRDGDSACTIAYLWDFDAPPSVIPSSTSVPNDYTAVEEVYHVSESNSSFSPTIQKKKHGLYCRLKTFLRALFQYKSDTIEGKLCKHKHPNDKCSECAIRMGDEDSESRFAYFYCEDPECPARKRCTQDQVDEVYGSEEDMRVAPLRLKAKDRVSFIHDDDALGDSLDNTYNTDTNASSSAAFFNTFPDPLFSSSPNPSSTQYPYSSPTEYSFNNPLYSAAQHADPITSQHVPIFTSQGFTSSRQSISGVEVLEENALATAVPMTPVSPTIVHIWQSKTSTIPTGETCAASAPPPELPDYDLDIINHSAIHGDVEAQTMIIELYQGVPASPGWSYAERYLIRKASLVLGLSVQKAAGRISPSVVEIISAQLFPGNSEVRNSRHIDDFADYICTAVDRGEISEARAMQIVTLVDDEDM